MAHEYRTVDEHTGVELRLRRRSAGACSKVKKFIRRAIYSLCLLTLKPATKSTVFRKIIFDVAKPDALLVSVGQGETFVVSASDKIIGRDTYIRAEPFEFNKMDKVLGILGHTRPKTLFIDIGANIGTMCIPAVKRGLFLKAIAIEPEPLNYSLLLANIHINRLSHKIVAHNLALGGKDDDRLLFELSKDNFGDHRALIKNESSLRGDGNRDAIMVRSETFDTVIKHIEPKESLIWMDTQGFEGHILSGAKKALELKVPICFEFWPYGMKRTKCFSLLKEALIVAEYKFLYDLNGSMSPIQITNESLDNLYQSFGDSGAHTELLAL